MLSIFQVNTGSFVDLHDDVNPSQKVGDLTGEICRSTRCYQHDVVLMTLEGVLMDKNQLIASYGAGTETKPILVFNRALLADPNLSHISSPDISDICQNQSIDEMSRKPHSLLQLVQGLQSQADQLETFFESLLCEQELQVCAWTAVQGNCRSILMTYQKQVGSLEVEHKTFKENLRGWTEKLQNFPETLALLRKVRVPKAMTNKAADVILFDWISEQDPTSNLTVLAEDCKQALQKLSADTVDSLLELSSDIIGNFQGTPEGVPGWKERAGQLLHYKQEMKKILERQRELAKVVMTTLQNALKSGDRSLIEDLRESQRLTLSNMASNDKKARDLLSQCFKSKKGLTENIHGRLVWVSEVQQKMSESSKDIVLNRDGLKLLKKKMTVFVQICDAPRVLTEVLGETLRRKEFDSAIVELSASYNHTAGDWKAEEKERRRSFLSSCGEHFLIRLFPSASERPGLTKRSADKIDRSLEGQQLTLKEAQDIINDLPESLALSFWTRSQMSLKADSTVRFLFGGHSVESNNENQEGSSIHSIRSLSPQLNEKSVSNQDSLLQELKHHIEELTKERSDLLKEKSDLAMEKSALLEDLAQKENRTTALHKQTEELEREKVVLVNRVSLGELTIRQLTEEKDTFQRQLYNVRSVESELQMQHSEVQQDLEMHRSQFLVEAERTDVLQQKVSQLEAIVTVLQTSKDQLVDQSQFLKDRNVAVLSEMEHLKTQCRTFEDECRVLVEEKEGLVEKVTQLQSAVDSKGDVTSNLEAELEALKKKQSQLEQLLEDASKEQDDMVKEIEQSKSKSTVSELEHSKLKQDLVEEKVKSETLRGTLDEQMGSFAAMYTGLTRVHEAVGTLRQALSMPGKALESLPSSSSADIPAFLALLNKVKDSVRSTGEHVSSLQGDLIQAEHSNLSLRQGRQHLEDEKHQLVAENEELLERNALLARTIREVQEKHGDLRGQVQKLQTENDQLHMKVSDLQSEGERMQRQLAEEEAVRGESVKRLEELHSQLQSTGKKDQSFEEKIAKMEVQLREVMDQLHQKEEDILFLVDNNARLQESSASLQTQLSQAGVQHREDLQKEQEQIKTLERDLKDFREKLFHKDQEKDEALKKMMELERDAKELNRSVDRALSESHQTERGTRQKYSPMSSSALATSTSDVDVLTADVRNPALTDSQTFLNVTVKNVSVGDIVLFMAMRREGGSHKEVFIAVTFDQRVYFLDTECAKGFTNNLTQSSVALGKSGKRTFLAKVLVRDLCEVRKADNRLGVPVGTKVYRITAQECFLVPHVKPV